MKKATEFIRLQWKLWLIASVTLGLAPFSPEPHLWGKLKWLAGGGVGMKGPDWFDLVMHGTPWVLLIISVLLILKNKISQ